MTFDRKITVISVALAVIASVAASLQSYVSWKGRNDPLRSTVLAEIARDCRDIAIDAGNSMAKNVPSDYTRQMLAYAAALDLLITAIETSRQMAIQAEVEKFLDDDFDQAADKAEYKPSKSANLKHEVEIRFMVNLNDKCAQVIEKQL